MKSAIEEQGIERKLKTFSMSQPASDLLLAYNKHNHREKQRAKISRCGSLEELARKRGKKV